MASNPFTEKLYLEKFQNKAEFAMTLFNKAAMKLYPARKGSESIRQNIIDFEGPANRNKFANVDDCVFYCMTDNSTTYWIGTTDIYSDDTYHFGIARDAIYRYDRIISDNERCILIPIPDTSTEENTIRTIRAFCDVVSWVLGTSGYNNITLLYAAVNYFYRVFGINLLLESNFDKVFIDNSIAISAPYMKKMLKNFIMSDKDYVKPLDGDLNYAKVVGAYVRFQESTREAKEVEDNKKYNISGFSDTQINYLRDMLKDTDESDYDNDTFYEFIDRNLADIINGNFDDYNEDKLKAVATSMVHFLPDMANTCTAYICHKSIQEYTKINVPEFFKTILTNVCEGLQKQALTNWDEDGLLNIFYTIIYLYAYLPNHDAKYIVDFIVENKDAKLKTIGEHKEVFKAFFDLAEKHYTSKDSDNPYMNPYMTEGLSSFISEHIEDINVCIKDIYEYILNCQVKSEAKDDSADGEVSSQEA